MSPATPRKTGSAGMNPKVSAKETHATANAAKLRPRSATRHKASAQKRRGDTDAVAVATGAMSMAVGAAAAATGAVATLAGISSAAVAKATGHGWSYWLKALDSAGAAKRGVAAGCDRDPPRDPEQVDADHLARRLGCQRHFPCEGRRQGGRCDRAGKASRRDGGPGGEAALGNRA